MCNTACSNRKFKGEEWYNKNMRENKCMLRDFKDTCLGSDVSRSTAAGGLMNLIALSSAISHLSVHSAAVLAQSISWRTPWHHMHAIKYGVKGTRWYVYNLFSSHSAILPLVRTYVTYVASVPGFVCTNQY